MSATRRPTPREGIERRDVATRLAPRCEPHLDIVLRAIIAPRAPTAKGLAKESPACGEHVGSERVAVVTPDGSTTNPRAGCDATMYALDRLAEVRTPSWMLEPLAMVDLATTLRAWLLADEAPAALRDAAARNAAGVTAHIQSTLFSTIWNQGTCFEGSEAVIPFFVEAALEPTLDATRRRFALYLLLHLAMGSPMEFYPVRYDPNEYHARADATGDPEARCAAAARDCHERVGEALPRLVALVNDAHDEVAIGAWMLLGFLGGPVALDALRRGVAREAGDRLASVLLGLAWWEPSAMVAPATAALRSAHRNLALHAAAVLAVAAPEGVCDEAIDVLTTPLGELADVFLPQYIEAEGVVSGTLVALRGGPWLRAIERLAARYEANPEDFGLRYALFVGAFGGRAAPSDDALQILAERRLPTTRAALRAWLEP